MTGRDKPVMLLGAPTDVGASRRGASMGPGALRVAGIAAMLQRLGRDVRDFGNIDGPPIRPRRQGKAIVTSKK